uniref:Uncharacterized protein n=1 Tax=Octactis speculum TaxID=3111310 RepID=A0A7S2HW55_9STRA|mmetsp:Transcript_9910/g.12925  ORF Transcript_9910/g.12925 Transcript_9910/m.12925 type:complete len:107 (+) Transcript_9910:414-734(+)
MESSVPSTTTRRSQFAHLDAHPRGILGMDITEGGAMVTSSWGQEALLWDIKKLYSGTGEAFSRRAPRSKPVLTGSPARHLKLAPSGSSLVVATCSNQIRVHSFENT